MQNMQGSVKRKSQRKENMPTCYAEAKYGEQHQNIKGHNGIFDCSEGIQLTTAIICLSPVL